MTALADARGPAHPYRLQWHDDDVARPGPPAAELSDVHKRYGSNRVLRGLRLRLEAGQFHALLGRNGAGKSTLMRILARRETPDAATGTVLGRPFEEDGPEHNRQLAYVSESIGYEVPLTVRDFFRRYPAMHPGWRLPHFLAIASELGLDLDKRFGAFSRGQRVQIACAAALVGEARILLLDEVTSVLDARARFYLVEAFGSFCKAGGSVLMATNIVAEVRDVADRVLLLEDGLLRVDVAAASLPDRFLKLFRPGGVEHPVFKAPGCVPLGRDDAGASRWLVARSDPLAAEVPASLIDTRRVTPEEAFVYFTGIEGGTSC